MTSTNTRTQIRPIRKSTIISNAEVVKEEQYSDGRVGIDKTGRKWGNTKMPKSFQWLRPRYSNFKGKFDFGDMPDEKIQELAKACRFKYERGPKQGEHIEVAYVTDVDDPFFQHSKLYTKLTEGGGEVRDNPVDQLMKAHLRTRAGFRLPDVDMKMAGVRQQYEMVDKDFDNRAKAEEVKESLDTIKLLTSTNVDKKAKICTVVGIKHDNTLGEDDLNAILYSFINESTEKTKEFRSLCELPTDKLNLKFYIKRGQNTRKITRPLDGVYMFNGENRMGRTLEEVEYFLLDKDNQDILDELMG